MVVRVRWIGLVGIPVIFVTVSAIISKYVDREVRTKLFKLNSVIVVQYLMFLGAIFAWKQIVTKVSPGMSPGYHSGRPGKSKFITLLLFQAWRISVLIFLILAQSAYILGILFVQTEPHWFVHFSYCCLGVAVLLDSILVVLIILESLCGVLQRMRILNSRCLTLNPHTRTVAVITIVTVLSIMGFKTANDGPWSKHVEIPVRNLPVSMDGFRISQLSDIHLGATVGKSKLMKAVDIARLWKPDLVVITGDLFDSTIDNLRGAVEPLKHLEAKYRVYFVTGNHEYYTGNVDGWFEHLKTLGVESLHNQHVKIINKEKPEDWFYLAGIDDIHADTISYTGHGMNLDEALTNFEENHAVILLAHQPKAAKIAIESRQDISLVLSGHVHAGQVLPLMITAYLLYPYFAGLYQVSEHTYIYVSSGTYYWGFPMRLANLPEVTYITLTRY